jgi:hypothetical protein
LPVRVRDALTELSCAAAASGALFAAAAIGFAGSSLVGVVSGNAAVSGEADAIAEGVVSFDFSAPPTGPVDRAEAGAAAAGKDVLVIAGACEAMIGAVPTNACAEIGVSGFDPGGSSSEMTTMAPAMAPVAAPTRPTPIVRLKLGKGAK